MATVAQCLPLRPVSSPSSLQGMRVVSSFSPSSCLSLSSRYAPFAGSVVFQRTHSRAQKFVAASSVDRNSSARAALSVPQVLVQVLEKLDLTQDQSETVMDTFLDEYYAASNTAQIGAFLALLRAKGETTEEITGIGKAMRRRCHPIKGMAGALDIVQTGGDEPKTLDISTGSAILAAACGGKVVKSGSRFEESTNVFESLGVAINLGPEGVAKCVSELSIGYMMTTGDQDYPANSTVAKVGKSMKIRTALDYLAPILNPARVPYAVVGVQSKSLAKQMARVLQEFGLEKALVVHSEGLDEMSPIGSGFLLEVTPTKIQPFKFDPLDFGIPRCTVADLKGEMSIPNAKIIRNALAGEEGHIANFFILNAGAGLVACGVTNSLEDGVALAREVQRSGKAKDLLDSWIALSWKLYRCEMEEWLKQHDWEMNTSSLS